MYCARVAQYCAHPLMYEFKGAQYRARPNRYPHGCAQYRAHPLMHQFDGTRCRSGLDRYCCDPLQYCAPLCEYTVPRAQPCAPPLRAWQNRAPNGRMPLGHFATRSQHVATCAQHVPNPAQDGATRHGCILHPAEERAGVTSPRPEPRRRFLHQSRKLVIGFSLYVPPLPARLPVEEAMSRYGAIVAARSVGPMTPSLSRSPSSRRNC
jgi:hypothetical protein